MRRTGARSFRPTLGSVVTTALGTAWALIVLLPIYFLLLGSFRSESDYLTSDPWLPSGGLTVSAYAAAVQGVGGAVINSVIVTVAVVLIVIIFGVPAAFALVRYRSRLTKTMYVLFLVGLRFRWRGPSCRSSSS